MRFILLFVFYLVSFSSFSQHERFFLDIATTKNTDEKIRRFISYLDNDEIAYKSTDDLNRFFVKLEQAEPSIKNYIAFHRQLLQVQKKTNNQVRINAYNELAKQYRKEKQKVFEGVCYLQIAQQQLNLKQYRNCLNNTLRANELFKEVQYQNIPEIGKYLHSLALIHFFFRDYEKVIALMESSYRYPLYSKNIDIQRDNNLAQAFMGLNRKKQAREYFFKALGKAEKYKDSTWVGLISGNLGDLSEKEGKFQTSLKYYKYGFAFVSLNKNPGIYKNLLLKISKGNILEGDLSEAELALNRYNLIKAEDDYFMGMQQQQEQTQKLYFEVNKLYSLKTKKFKKAYFYADSLFNFSAQHDSIYNKLNIDLSYHKLENEKQLLELMLKENEKKQITYRYIILVFCLSAFSVLVYFFMKRRKDRQKKLFHLKEQLMEEDRLYLTKEVDILKKDIELHLKKITENNKLIEKYKFQLKHLEKGTEHNQKQIEHTRIDIQNLKILTKEHWENFLTDFKKSNKRFYNLVIRILPDLTQSEQRFLFLLKLGIPQKNLANVIGTSNGNIRVTLHRLKLKIKEKGEDADLDKIKALLLDC